MKIEEVQKFVADLHDETEYLIHIRNLKQALNHGLVLKTVHRVIKFIQNAWLKPYIDMNTDLRKKAKSDFEKKIFLSWWIIQFSEKLENVRKKRFQTCHNRTKKELFSIRTKLNFQNKFTEYLLAIEMRKTQMLPNKPLYLVHSVLELDEILMCGFWYDYVKPKYSQKVKLCHMDTDVSLYA